MSMLSSFIQRIKNHKLVKRAGFTLVELMISSAIFITVASLAMEALIAMQQSYVRVDGLRAVMDSLNTSFDLMGRDLRYGTVFFCGQNIEDPERSFRKSCPYTGSPNDGGTALMFKPANAVSYTVRKGYFLYDKKVYEYAVDQYGATSTLPITGEDVFIDSLRFFVQGANTTQAAITAGNTENAPSSSPDNLQPVVTVVIAGHAGGSSNKTKDSHFQLETTIVPRPIDQ